MDSQRSLLILAFLKALGSSPLSQAGVVPAPPLKDIAAPPVHKTYLTENSIQTRPTEEEAKSMIALVRKNKNDPGKFDPFCSGFLVANSKGHHLIATASHCARFYMDGGCADGTFKISPEIKRSALASCIRKVAGTPKDDMVIIQTHLDQDVIQKMKPLRLAKFCPATGVRLREYGYPADPVNQGAPTVTSGCNDLTGAAQAWDTGKNNMHTQPSLPPIGDQLFDDAAKKLNFAVQWSNCSSYGGNSGGPVLIDGYPEVAIGMVTRWYDSNKVHPEHSSNPYEATCGFYEHNLKALKKLGVLIEDFPPDLDSIPAQVHPREREKPGEAPAVRRPGPIYRVN